MMNVIRVLCVDDNPLVADGVRIKLSMAGEGGSEESKSERAGGEAFEWVGHLTSADELMDAVRRTKPNIVLLDIDMPGKAAMAAMSELSQAHPEIRTIILSGFAREDYLDRAVESGAWGYVSKNDGPDQIVDAIRQVVAGRFAFGPSVIETPRTLSAAR